MFCRNLGRKKVKKKSSFKDRIVMILVFSLILTGSIIGIYSYIHSKMALLELMEQRINRELDFFNEVTKNNRFIYDSESDFRSSLQSFVDEQSKDFTEDGYSSNFYLIDGNEIFSLTDASNITFSKELLSNIKQDKDGIIHTYLNGKLHTLGFQNIQELEAIYTIVIPQEDYLQSIELYKIIIPIVTTLLVIFTSILMTIFINPFNAQLRMSETIAKRE